MDDRLPHRFVLVFGLLFGGSLIFLTPPFSVPDETSHFHRAYHCSQGKIYAYRRGGTTGDDLPCSLAETYLAIIDGAVHDEQFEISWAKIDKAADIPLDPQRRRFTVFSNTALYSPLPYLPQSAVICCGRLCQLAPLRLFYLARAANLVAYLLLAATAVRLAPIQKWTMALVALIPMSVYSVRSASTPLAELIKSTGLPSISTVARPVTCSP